MKKLTLITLFTAILFITGCNNNQPVSTPPADNPPQTIGGDKDEGGCLIGAGYSWCEAKQKCLRVWEEPCEEEPSAKEVKCKAEQRNADVCAEIYQPVCATVNIQCFTAPCDPIQETFGNSCEACRNPLVESYIEGEC